MGNEIEKENLISSQKKTVSIVIPALNEARNLPELYARLNSVIASIPEYDFEILFIDNASTDSTYADACQLASTDLRWNCLRFSRNFSAEASLAAGLEFASGDAVILLFSDLQEPPEEIPRMIRLWEDGNDIIYGKLKNRADRNLVVTFCSKAAYKLLHYLTDIHIPMDATDYRLLSRRSVNAVKRCDERCRYLRGLTHWVGFKQVAFEYSRSPRKKGKSSTDLRFLARYLFNALVAFSASPLAFASIAGLIATGLSIIGSIVYLLLYVFSKLHIVSFHPPPAGWSTLIIVILFFSGIQCFFLGIMGKYISNIYDENKKRPLWILQDSHLNNLRLKEII